MKLAVLLLLLWGSVVLEARSHYIKGVPYRRQITDYSCGDASLEMVLEYSGPDVDQRAIIDAARTSNQDGTNSGDIVRVGRFSMLSTGVGANFPKDIPVHGFVGRPIGYAAFGHTAPHHWLEELKNVIDHNIPVVVLMKYALNDTGGHFRVVVGYDDTNSTIFTNDPWNRPPDTREIVGFSYEDFVFLWNHTDTQYPYFGAMAIPWHVTADAIKTNQNEITIKASYTYVCVPPFPCGNTSHTATNTLASIADIPDGVELAPNAIASVWLGDTRGGGNGHVSWVLKYQDINKIKGKSITVKVQGFVHGSVVTAYCDYCVGNYYNPYEYVDVIGGQTSVTLA